MVECYFGAFHTGWAHLPCEQGSARILSVGLESELHDVHTSGSIGKLCLEDIRVVNSFSSFRATVK